MKNWNYWRLIGAGGMSLLTVLFFVIWQAVARQTDTLNQVMERLGELEKTPQTNNSRLLEEQLQSLKVRLNNQGKTLNDLLEEQQSIAKREEEYFQPQAETWQVQPEPPASLTPPPPELTTP
ncbi:MAG TPA: signal protein [Prochlorococcaceae cyanobacterium Gl_MAG_24]|nr:signal protein [Prochlorococcaceae cyanobacterium Gl_MAG_24]